MLEKIVAQKRKELETAKAEQRLPELLRTLPERPAASFTEALQQKGLNVIAEVKYHSPSRGDFPCRLPPEQVAESYAESGAAAVSVLTDRTFFKGEPGYLQQIHAALPQLPLLRKDFILDPYQVAEAAAWGASAYLLIAACLEPGELASLLETGTDYGISALVEVHDLWELERAVNLGCQTIGVNNRNLKTFEVNLNTSFELARRLEGESGYLLVSESGLSHRSQLEELRDAGFAGFLIGSHFMESNDPGLRLKQLLDPESQWAV